MSQNDITGDEITSKASTHAYRAGWERIFGSKPRRVPAVGEGDYDNLMEIKQWEENNQEKPGASDQ